MTRIILGRHAWPKGDAAMVIVVVVGFDTTRDGRDLVGLCIELDQFLVIAWRQIN